MATKRPASSRAMKPPSQPTLRSRSAMARPVAASPNTLEGSSSNPATTGPSNSETECNIQVVVRCRHPSERERQDKSSVIVSATNKQVSIKTSAPGVTPPLQRIYPFDIVFGPEADQAMVYHEVVSPMLGEVMMGYNCTLFAYGQTGTGKTYTMQGDLMPTKMGNPSPEAGMIPRVLFRLFHQLESSKSDYSVKISYVELYNEELRDLLANDLPSPAGSSQPMAMTSSKDSKNPSDSGLKIFDDAAKRGVVIQGLEETSVKDCKDALAILTKGSQRRQIAATKFNDHSSRSHSIFSITVHIKEAPSVGNHLLKVGKLNLVDLAGSENIGRSGAENKRAREAGMINQSLLTLGRVINALVDRSSHVPYRESKLTRLLQDSLGGRTKTCIIATISPVHTNMEETLSTLDYALRAKSIRNKPEANQRVARDALMNDFVAKIRRLEADLLATREKSGVFLSQETWEEMAKEQETAKTERDEATNQVGMLERQLRAVREEFDQTIAMLMRKDQELEETRDQLRGTEEVLQVTEGELTAVKAAFKEEVVMREAHQSAEHNLDEVATRLHHVVKQSVADVEGLFHKLDRKSAVIKSNSKTVASHSQAISSTTNVLSERLQTFISSSSQHLAGLQSQTQDFQAHKLKLLSSCSSRIEKQTNHIQTLLGNIRGKDAAEEAALDAIQRLLADANKSITSSLGNLCDELTKKSDAMCDEIKAVGTSSFSQLESTIQCLISCLQTAFHEAEEYVAAEQASLQELATLASRTKEHECARLREQNAALRQLLAQEQASSKKDKEELTQSISLMVSTFLGKRDARLTEAVQKAIESNSSGGKEMDSFGSSAHTLADAMNKRGIAIADRLNDLSSNGEEAEKNGAKIIKASTSKFKNGVLKLQGVVSSSSTTILSSLDQEMSSLHAGWSNGFEQHSRAKRARLDDTSSLVKSTQSTLKVLQDSIASTSSSITTTTHETTSKLSELETNITSFNTAATSYLSSQRQAVTAITSEGNREDTPTGSTPRKRKWVYDEHWDRTGNRADVLSEWRKRRVPSEGGGGDGGSGGDMYVPCHTALPEGDDGEIEQDDGGDIHKTILDTLPLLINLRNPSPPPPAKREKLMTPDTDLPQPTTTHTKESLPPI
ncbi:hypothetical protein ONZ45_g18018 [Pleurotus djamor]|nr:hypothetical protein ONZ45_g18018 [Pleurotus djamor]